MFLFSLGNFLRSLAVHGQGCLVFGVTHLRCAGWPDDLSVHNRSTFLLSCISPAQNQSVWLRRVSWPHHRALASFRTQSLNWAASSSGESLCLENNSITSVCDFLCGLQIIRTVQIHLHFHFSLETRNETVYFLIFSHFGQLENKLVELVCVLRHRMFLSKLFESISCVNLLIVRFIVNRQSLLLS
jgi:hypothetical protein